MYPEGSAEKQAAAQNAVAFKKLVDRMVAHIGPEADQARQWVLSNLLAHTVQVASAGLQLSQKMADGQITSAYTPSIYESESTILENDCSLLAELMNMAPELWR